MAIRKERRLSPLRDKPFKKKEAQKTEDKGERKDRDLSYEGGIDSQQDQLNDLPKNTEDWQNDNESKDSNE
ncbi:hypothetical protein [Olivibacter domesticus]|uniref:Uncharacterized protein n=1 Tax=Olivibacter domesticus TaxID=407022 RepID=A0A1H7KGH6_OLID1|nr:hypothetical protein [Olivibacter domesticus]SEK85620.1 hypothetical protein SAMN05661044_01336 [Olivibacter domesticus]